MYELLKRINDLKRTPRMGWIESGIEASEAEDVAQHSFETAAITLLLSNSLKENLDNDRALKMAVVHDWAEAITGDFSQEISSELGFGIKEKIEEGAIENLLKENIPNREEYLEIWKEYLELESRESKLVHIADRLSILFEASYLFQKGESSEKLIKIWKTVEEELQDYTEDFPILEDLLKKLEENYPEPK
ncbi:hypothetical protein AKJ53_00395 [candidate division MSBL1 archaeon SCGC-AAA382F02]|uniref:5'-deoxynucleotidase n=1 Tax=candidate division MSBL1 archaeon SCGC-AAA382F02 TaxID=1698282 RepID=A0A133VJ03_9EURY|nr:hypothetical protein AKJ53_00395 [candidate division MSBL1 archaeon SCGC-AAA382F02]